MHPVNRLHWVALEHTLAYHHVGATTAFLSGLEYEVHRAVEARVVFNLVASREQHRHMAIVTASVHLVGVLRFIAEIVGFGNRQTVELGA